MKAQLQKSLIAILIFNATILNSAKAQIVYTDVNPDITKNTNGAVYHLDLNNDGTTDFDISINSGFHSCSGFSFPVSSIRLDPAGTNNVLLNNTPYADALSLNALIAGTQNWSTGTIYSMASLSIGCNGNSASGPWINATDKYLGLRFVSGGNTYYGWARLNSHIGLPPTFTIKDYAYNSVPNQPILAGQTCTTPTVTLSPGGSLSICQGDNVTLTANGTGSQYQWKKNGVNISGAIQQTYIAKTAGTYNVIVTNGCGMSQTSNSAIVTVGLPCKNSDASLFMTSDALEYLSVYPNPATNSVTIKIPSDDAGEIQIINLFGCVVETHNYASLLESQMQIDVTKFPAGMYVVRWISRENYQAEKFSVMH